MKEKFESISVGQIWKVSTDEFMTSGKSNKYERKIKLNKHELIEIRYPYEWHFRTIDNHYWHIGPDDLIKNCVPFGVIWEKVRFNNRCNLSEIINLGLFDPFSENQYVWAKNLTGKELKKLGLNKLVSSFEEKHKDISE